MNIEVPKFRCAICSATEAVVQTGSKVRRSTCKGCRCSEIKHLAGQADDKNLGGYWQQNGSAEFNSALVSRRSKQARSFLSRYVNKLCLRSLPPEAIFDYGCGLGAMVTVSEEFGLDISGCDLSIPDDTWTSSQNWRTERFVQLNAPWDVPLKNVGKARCIFLLDVLEHNTVPLEFLSSFPNADCFVIKVPNVNGPLGFAASALFRFHDRLFNRLALVGDVAPHVWFFSGKGLDILMSRRGFRLVGSLHTVEVGVEAGARTRSGSLSRLRLVPLSMIGLVLGFVSPLWSESIFRVYWRDDGTPGHWMSSDE